MLFIVFRLTQFMSHYLGKYNPAPNDLTDKERSTNYLPWLEWEKQRENEGQCVKFKQREQAFKGRKEAPKKPGFILEESIPRIITHKKRCYFLFCTTKHWVQD